MKVFTLIIFFTLLLFSEKIELLLGTEHLNLNKKIIKSLKNDAVDIDIKEKNSVFFNIEEISKVDKIRLGIIQNEALIYYQNYKNNNLNNEIKLIIPLYDKLIYIFALKKSQVHSINDLKEKTVSIGKKYSSSWFVGNIIRKEHNISWREKNYEISDKNSLKKVAKKLQEGEIDAFIYVERDNNESNLIDKHFQKTISNHLSLIEVESNFFKKIIIQKGKHKWLDSKSKKILFSKELIVVHNFFYRKGKTPDINKKYEEIIDKIRKLGAKNIKNNFAIKTRDFHGITWEKWVKGSLIGCNL